MAVATIGKAYRLVSRDEHPVDTVVRVSNTSVGGLQTAIMAGPCAVESREQLLAAALAAKAAGATVLRGGAFKPRTSPYDFQGLGERGLQLLAEARALTGLPIVTEVMDSEEVDLVARYADILQIGARNMSAFRLLERVAQTGKPVLLKRGLQATIRELLMSAEYVMANGNDQVILCERGIRSYDSEFTRNVLDLAAVAVLKNETHLPVIVDPSHATGQPHLVAPMCRAALAVGADGLMIEIHPTPGTALCDGKQSLDLESFANLMSGLRRVASLGGRAI